MISRQVVRIAFVLALAPLWFVPAGHADAILSFSVIPLSGNVSGVAGSTVGWGYTITNSSLTDWLVIDGVNAGVFQHGKPDASIFDLPILGPGQTRMVSYDPVNFLGLYQLTWDVTAPEGFVNSGTFTVAAEWWNGDPSVLGSSFLALAVDQSARYSATVSPAASPVPEPSTLVLLLGGLAAVGLRSRRKPNYSDE